MDRLSGLIESLKLYGFAIMINKEDIKHNFIDILRNSGIIHMLNIRKLDKYVIIEVNIYGCEKECDINCRDGSGKKDRECYGECLDSCVTEKLADIIKIVQEGKKI